METGLIALVNDAPQIPGLSFRRFQDATDFTSIANLRAVTNAHDQVESADDPEQIRYFFEHQEGLDVHNDLILALVDGQLVAYTRMFEYTEKASRDRVYSLYGLTHPAWRGQGLGAALVRALEHRARCLAQANPPETSALVESFIVTKRPGAVALFEQLGYQQARNFVMMKRPDLENIPDLPLPEGVETRQVLPEHYRLIWDASCEAFSEHWGYFDVGEDAYQAYLKAPEFQPHLWQVAWYGDQVIGMVRSFINEKENARYGFRRGWTEDICVLKSWRGKGIASALIARSLQTLKERGMEHATLGVDVDNPTRALRLYQSLGYQIYQQEACYRKTLHTRE